MENTSHTNNKKEAKQPTSLYLDKVVLPNTLPQNFEITQNKSHADIVILDHPRGYLIELQDANKSFFSSERNLHYALSKLVEPKTAEISEITPIKYKKNIDKLLSETSDIHLHIQNFKQLFEQSSNASNFIQKLFTNSFFSSYSSFHLFSHQKGSATAFHHHITRNNINFSEQSIKEFSNLFLSVKKSKNRSFGQTDLKASNFQIIGTCIAHELSLKNFNIILLVSKDDFLPQDESSISCFKILVNSLGVFLENLLNIEFNTSLSDTIHSSVSLLLNETFGNKNIITDKNLREIDFKKFLSELKNKKFDHAEINFQERVILLGELLNTLRHELSNPLFGLELSSELLLSECEDEEQLDFIKSISESIKRSQSILNSFTQLYKDNLETDEFNFTQTIKEVVTLAKSEVRKIKIQYEFGSHENEVIKSNQTWIAQILFNLIINSAQAMNTNNIVNQAIKIVLLKNKNHFLLEISDNGPGISKDNIEKIFNPFYTTKVDGNGLGLAISKKLANKLGGDLRYKSIPIGACFVLELPL